MRGRYNNTIWNVDMKGDHIKIAHEIAFIIKWPQSKQFIIKVYNRVTSNHNMLHKNKKEVKRSGKVASTVSLRFHLSSQFYRGTRLKEFQFWCSSKTSNFKQHLRFVYNVDLSMFDSFQYNIVGYVLNFISFNIYMGLD